MPLTRLRVSECSDRQSTDLKTGQWYGVWRLGDSLMYDRTMDDAIPTQADWESEVWDHDIRHAYQQFGGKSFEEAVELFEENAMFYQEDVCYMPRACFPFYARAFIAYLFSEASEGDSDSASSFFGLVTLRADDIILAGPLYPAVAKTLKHIAAGQDWYDSEREIYGDFADRAEEALARLRSFGQDS